MIYCPQCGNPNFDDANFCDTCGEPLVSADAYAQIKEQAEMSVAAERERQEKQMHAYAKAYDKAKKEAASGAGAGAAGAGAGASGASGASASGASNSSGATPPPSDAFPPPGGASYSQGASGSASQVPNPAPQITVYKHGCVAQAWDDITESPGWGKKMAILGLINCVPILNFFTYGYAMNWAAQLESDRVEPMPQKIMGDGFFLQGFYAIIAIIVFSVIGGIASSILSFIPVLGVIVGIVLGFAIQICYTLSIMRIAISRELGPGFAFADIWAACTENNQLGKLFCATIVPGIVVGAATLFICGSILVLFGLASLSNIFNIFQMIDAGYPEYMYSQALVSLILAIIPLILICCLVCAFLQVFQIVLTLRATSHFIMRYLPNWRSLATQDTYQF